MRTLLSALALVLVPALALPAGAAAALPVPYLQNWSDTGLLSVDDDWSALPGLTGYRGDGLVEAAGVDPRTVTADGAMTPVDVSANRSDPAAVGLAAGVAEFELDDPVVAIQGSATSGAPQLVLGLDTRGRTGIGLRLVLRDIDASSTSDAVQPVAIQYRAGSSGPFGAVPGGFVGDATSGPGEASLSTPMRVTLPLAADDQPLVEVRVLTTNAIGQDEWVGIDDIELSAAGGSGPAGCPMPPAPVPPGPTPLPPPAAPAPPPAGADDDPPAVGLSDLEIAPSTFPAALRGPAIGRRGRAGAALRFRLTAPATVRFQVVPVPASGARPSAAPLRFSVRSRRGLNRLRLSGRVRGRALAPGAYRLLAVAVGRGGRRSDTLSADFTIRARARPRHPGRT